MPPQTVPHPPKPLRVFGRCRASGGPRSVVHREDDTKLRLGWLLAIAAFVCCGLASARALAQNAYITNASNNTVSVIDTATNTVTATIPVGVEPLGVAVTPDGRTVYVAGTGLFVNAVSVIDTATNAVTATIPGFTDPAAFGISIGPATRFAGTPGFSNCPGVSVSALSIQYGGDLSAAAKALGFSSVLALQNAIRRFCAG